MHTRCLINLEPDKIKYIPESNRFSHLCKKCHLKSGEETRTPKLDASKVLFDEVNAAVYSILDKYQIDPSPANEIRMSQEELNGTLSQNKPSTRASKDRRRKPLNNEKPIIQKTRLKKRAPVVKPKRLDQSSNSNPLNLEEDKPYELVTNNPPLKSSPIKPQRQINRRRKTRTRKRSSSRINPPPVLKRPPEKRPKNRGFNLTSILGKSDEVDGKPWVDWKLLDKSFYKPLNSELLEQANSCILDTEPDSQSLIDKDIRECYILKDVLTNPSSNQLKVLIMKSAKSQRLNRQKKASNVFGIGYFGFRKDQGNPKIESEGGDQAKSKHLGVSPIFVKSSFDILESKDDHKYRSVDLSTFQTQPKLDLPVPAAKLASFVPISKTHLEDVNNRQEIFSKVFRKLNSKKSEEANNEEHLYTSTSELYYLKAQRKKLQDKLTHFIERSAHVSEE